MIASWTSAKKSDKVFATSPYPDFCPSNSFIVHIKVSKYSAWIRMTRIYMNRPTLTNQMSRRNMFIWQTILGKHLKALNVHVTKAKFDFIFTMWICNMETQQRESQIAGGDIKKSFINCKQLREWVSESEQLMRDAPSVRYDPRFNVKCLLGGIDNAGIPRLSRGNADPNQTNAFCTDLPNGALSVELLFVLVNFTYVDMHVRRYL